MTAPAVTPIVIPATAPLLIPVSEKDKFIYYCLIALNEQ